MDDRRLGFTTRLAGIVPVLFAFVLVACGSSDEGGGTGGTGVTSRNVGAITSTDGALSVNGIAYDTRAAAITVDKQTADAAALRVGMVVTVDGTIDASGVAGTASRIEYDHELEGPIDFIDLAGNSLVVLGQAVSLSVNTQFDGGANTFVVSDIVEVSGFRDAADVLHATYIKKESGSGAASADVEGVISNLNANLHTFNIYGLTVQYGGAAVSGTTALSDGQYVEVDGAYTGGVLIASEVEVESPSSDSAGGERMKIEGYVTDFASSAQFKVNGRPVETTAQTLYEHGTAEDLRLDVALSVEGAVNTSGVLVATKVEFK